MSREDCDDVYERGAPILLSQKLKRTHSGDEDDETPLFSPSPSNSEDGQEEEEIGTSLHRTLGSFNLGKDLLLKMGWKEGSGLGIGGFGRVDPIPISEKRGGDMTGIGKTSQDTRTIASSTANRRLLDSEKQLNETEAERLDRLALLGRKQAQKEDVIQALKTYRCELCQKQYDRPSTFEAHLNSYDHHHKKRFMEMKASQKGKIEATGALEKKREREKKRESKEMAKMAEAAGIQLQPSTIAPNVSTHTDASSLQQVNSIQTASKTSGGSGWKKVVAQKPEIRDKPAATSTGSSSWKRLEKPQSLSTSTTTASSIKPIAPFRSSGFNTLDTSRVEKVSVSNDQTFIAPPPALPAPPSPPPPPPL